MKVICKGSVIELSAQDRGIIDEIIVALITLGDEKCISYGREINWLKELREL